MPLDYLSSNELNKYPFKDNSSMIGTNNALPIKNTFFADLLISYKTSEGKLASLVNIYNDTEAEELILEFSFLSDMGAFLTNGHVIAYAEIITHEMKSFDHELYSLKIVFGSGFNELTQYPEETNFGVGIADIEESAIIMMVPRVTSIAFYTVDELETVLYGDELNDLDVIMQEGSNVSFTSETNKVVLSVFPGAGTGLYDPCENELVIKTINSVGPDLYNNFLLLTDDCYTVEAIVAGLNIENICTPRCTATQLGNFAHYLNRVKDGINTVVGLAGDTYGDIRDEIDDYTTNFLPTKNKPRIVSSIVKNNNPYDPGYDYYSFAVTFINRSPDDVDITSTIGLSDATLLPDSFRYIQGEDVELLGGPNISKSLPCLKVSRLEFTVKSLSGTVTVGATAGTTSYNKVYTV